MNGTVKPATLGFHPFMPCRAAAHCSWSRAISSLALHGVPQGQVGPYRLLPVRGSLRLTASVALPLCTPILSPSAVCGFAQDQQSVRCPLRPMTHCVTTLSITIGIYLPATDMPFASLEPVLNLPALLTMPAPPPAPAPAPPPAPAQAIDVFDVTRGYARVCRCVGHSSTVRHLDWAADSGAIQSVDQAYEVGRSEAEYGVRRVVRTFVQ